MAWVHVCNFLPMVPCVTGAAPAIFFCDLTTGVPTNFPVDMEPTIPADGACGVYRDSSFVVA